MSEVHYLAGKGNQGSQPPAGAGGDGMDTRVAKLETKLDTILPTLATKGDVSEAKASIVMWLAGVIAASTAIIIAVLAFMLNRAIPAQPTQAAPVVVYPPQQMAPSPQSLPTPPAAKRGQ